MKALTYIDHNNFALQDKLKPVVQDPHDAVVRVTVNVETFCGECYFCQRGWVNNCTDPNGGWAARISEIQQDDTVLIIGAGPTGICTLLCVIKVAVTGE